MGQAHEQAKRREEEATEQTKQLELQKRLARDEAFGRAYERAKARSTFGPEAAKAETIAVIMDTSGSMLNKFSTARVVVSRFLGSLDQRTSFALIASGEAAEAVSDSLVPASQDNVSKAEAFIEDKITPKGDDGRLTEAFQKAVALKPQRIVFVTDGDFLSGPVVEKVRASNVPITVAIIRTAYDGVGDTTAAEHLSGVTPGGLVMHIRDE